MGIHERDYVRRAAPPRGAFGGGARSMRMWSVNTWLIVICVGVFVIDGFLGTHPVIMGEPDWFINNPDAVDQSALVEGGIVVVNRDRQGKPLTGYRPLYLKSTGPVEVGRRPVMYMPPLEGLLHFSTKRGFLGVQYWRFLGFQFLHSHDMLMHLVFNMIGLYFFGPLVEQYLGSKRYLAFYLLCGMCGALMYVILNLGGYIVEDVLGLTGSVPGLLFNDIYTRLIGASAGVFGVLLAGAYLAPDARVLLFFVLPMRLRTLAYGFVALAVLNILLGGSNAGGDAGHVGGAIAGFYFIRYPHHLHGFFDVLGRIDPTSHHYRPGRGGTPSRARAISRVSPRRSGSAREIDRILDKVHGQGLGSLTDAEKRALREASEK